MSELAKHQGIYSAISEPRYAGYGHTNHGAKALPLVEKAAPGSLVDVGCGWNEFCLGARAAVPGINAVGVDFACPGADVPASATALPFPDKSFDLLTSFDTLQHLLPEEVDAALTESARVSRHFIFSISYEPSDKEWQGQNLHPTVRGESWWIRRIIGAGGCSIKVKGLYLTGEWQEPLRIHPEARVILVGNGPSVLFSEQDATIDGFDEIVRFNRYVIHGFEKHVGTRTTLWSTYGHGAVPQNPAERPQRVIYTHGEAGGDAKIDKVRGKPMGPAYMPANLYRIPKWYYGEMRRALQSRSLWRHGLANDPGPLLPSSGLVIAAWLLDIVGVKNLTLTGLDHFCKERSRQHHYWHPQAFFRPKEHDGDAEAAMFGELREAGRVTYL